MDKHPVVDKDRYWQSIMDLSRFTEPDRPWTRLAFSPEYKAARTWLAEEMQAAGLEVSVDAGANLIGRRKGTDAGLPPILIGSHIDTTPGGGRFDGIAGVLVGLELARALNDAGRQLRHDLEVIDYFAEEANEYGISCIGSQALIGRVPAEGLDGKGPDGRSVGDVITEFGGNPQEVARGALRPPASVAASLEMHIEQGKVLESLGLQIGVVSEIVGITRVNMKTLGLADHAGATPMDLRQDALVAAARIIDWISTTARQTAAASNAYLVATVGKLDVLPNGSNVIPGEVDFAMDLRSNRSEMIAQFIDRLQENAPGLIVDLGVEIHFETEISPMSPSFCDEKLQEGFAAACQKLGKSWQRMPSGAGHDSMFLGALGPAAMIFIPCLEGRSHCAEEWAEPEQLADGAEVMLQMLLDLDAGAVQG